MTDQYRRALTICQPYASLICLPDDDPRAKRVENRTWETHWRGPILIHAGKSREWLKTCDLLPVESLPFGAVIGVAKLVACVRMGLQRTFKENVLQRFPWLPDHAHAEGPWCWVLQDCRALLNPIPCTGDRGLWVPDLCLRQTVGQQLMAIGYLP